MTGSPLDEARALFWEYEGSRFYMSRNGVESDYLAYNVPKEIEKAWLEEITVEKLNRLQEPNNWRSVYYLWHHRDTRHLERVMRAEPLGDWLQRLVFLEVQLDYINVCLRTYAPRDIVTAVRTVIVGAESMQTSAPDDQLRNRANHLVRKATDFASSLDG